MFIFPLVYIISYFIALKEVYKGNPAGILVFLIFGLSIYTTAMSVAFMLGLKDLIPIFQVFKEVLVFSVLILNIVSLRHRPRFHVIDYWIFAFLLLTVIYAILPIGEQSFVNRLIALKSLSFYIVVYFTGRLIDPRTIYVNKYFNYILLLTIATAAVLIVEVVMQQQLQTITGYAEYNYYFFNFEPAGMFGLSTTFESEGGYRRFASFFGSPIEHGLATVIALSVIVALYTRDDNKFKINGIGIIALLASLLSIIFAFSRSPLVSYFLIIYVYALLTKRKLITNTIHISLGIAAAYIIYLFVRFENTNTGIMEVVMNTIDFSNPSSLGHIAQWAEGIVAMTEHPLGMGIGSSGRVAASISENVGGENQFIIIGVQTGIAGLLMYLSIFVLFIKSGLKWLPVLKGKERKVCMAVLLMKVGFLIPLLTSEVETSSYISYMNWFLSGLFISIIMQPKRTQLPVAYD
jgi:hypothetical protein